MQPPPGAIPAGHRAEEGTHIAWARCLWCVGVCCLESCRYPGTGLVGRACDVAQRGPAGTRPRRQPWVRLIPAVAKHPKRWGIPPPLRPLLGHRRAGGPRRAEGPSGGYCHPRAARTAGPREGLAWTMLHTPGASERDRGCVHPGRAGGYRCSCGMWGGGCTPETSVGFRWLPQHCPRLWQRCCSREALRSLNPKTNRDECWPLPPRARHQHAGAVSVPLACSPSNGAGSGVPPCSLPGAQPACAGCRDGPGATAGLGMAQPATDR